MNATKIAPGYYALEPIHLVPRPGYRIPEVDRTCRVSIVNEPFTYPSDWSGIVSNLTDPSAPPRADTCPRKD